MNLNQELSKVLIVDDTVFAIQILNMYCQKVCNIKVDTAISGEEAIMMVQQRITNKQPTYRLIVMDINMPGLDGVQTTANIRKILTQYAAQRDEEFTIVAHTAL